MRIRVVNLLFICLLAALVPATGLAQSELRLQEAAVSLWPEYDQPSMLVIYHLSLSPESPIPAEVRLRIPAGSQVNAVASRQPDGALLNLAHDEATDGTWLTLSFTATTPDIQVEYYQDLQRDGDQRAYEYRWSGDYAVSSFTIEVQQPVGATNMQISPSLGTGTVQSGLTYYTANQGALSAGQTFSISIKYNKSSDTLSIGEQPVRPSAPLENGDGRNNPMAAIPWILGGAGLLLIGVSAFWYFYKAGNTKPVTRSKRHNRVKAAKPRVETPVSGGNEPIYCHQCGNRANPGDRFCRTCGTTLRMG